MWIDTECEWRRRVSSVHRHDSVQISAKPTSIKLDLLLLFALTSNSFQRFINNQVLILHYQINFYHCLFCYFRKLMLKLLSCSNILIRGEWKKKKIHGIRLYNVWRHAHVTTKTALFSYIVEQLLLNHILLFCNQSKL